MNIPDRSFQIRADTIPDLATLSERSAILYSPSVHLLMPSRRRTQRDMAIQTGIIPSPEQINERQRQHRTDNALRCVLVLGKSVESLVLVDPLEIAIDESTTEVNGRFRNPDGLLRTGLMPKDDEGWRHHAVLRFDHSERVGTAILISSFIGMD